MRLTRLIFSLSLTLMPVILNAQGMCGFIAPISAESSSKLTGFVSKGVADQLSNNFSLSADLASIETDSENIIVEGNVELISQDVWITGKSASYNASLGEFTVNNSAYAFSSINARGNADKTFVSQAGIAILKGVKYTTCPEDREVWSLTAKEITLDTNKGMASARSAALRLRGVPVLYLPYATYPISDKRKSGLLLPTLSTSNQRGLEISTPWYWNIAPNYDATLTPNYMSKRGLMMGAEVRALTKSTAGEVSGNYLSNDEITGTDRYEWNIESKTAIARDWRVAVNATGVSDDRYLNDFSNRWSTSSQTALNQSAVLEHYGAVWSVMMRFQNYQTIDELLPDEDEPYRRLPQLAVIGDWQNSFLGANYRLETEATYFKRRIESVEGLRVHLEPEISYEFDYKGIYLTPKVSIFHTSYNLENEPANQSDTPSVTAGVYSIDSGATFERGFSDGLTVTLEPRAQYVYVPYKDQSELPVFDTILPDMNLVQLFRPNRYLQYDRIGDTNQLNVGFTSRVFGSSSGREILTATIGTSRYFSDQRVTLPGETPRTSKSGDYLLQARVDLYDSWNLEAGYQWNAATQQTDQGNIRFQLKPANNTVINADYRYQRESTLDQGGLSFGWAVNERWNLLGRAVYSFEEERFVDQFAAIEYGGCCWGIRLIYRERVSRDIEEDDTSIGIQFVLKGFAEIGNSVRSQLEGGILGYSDL